ncbi:MAG: hypothetical protein H8D45_20950 [Bacteroidetes bacterium]|nr:hypothetical protein [Bacteroidota bacterium]
MLIGDIIKMNVDGISTRMEVRGFDDKHVVLVSTGNGQQCLVVERQKLEEDLASLIQDGGAND